MATLPPDRRRVWEALDDGETAGTGLAGYRRRANLDLMTVEHVKAVWAITCPTGPAADDVLEAARAVLDGRVSSDEADDRQGRALVAFPDRMSSDGEFAAGYAGNAACTALSTATHDKSYADIPRRLTT